VFLPYSFVSTEIGMYNWNCVRIECYFWYARQKNCQLSVFSIMQISLLCHSNFFEWHNRQFVRLLYPTAQYVTRSMKVEPQVQWVDGTDSSQWRDNEILQRIPDHTENERQFQTPTETAAITSTMQPWMPTAQHSPHFFFSFVFETNDSSHFSNTIIA